VGLENARPCDVPFARGIIPGTFDVQTLPSDAPRSERLRVLLSQDSGNPGLALALATALYEEGDYRASDTLLGALPDTSDAAHLRGLVALSLSRFAEAEACFSGLLVDGADPTVRYNLAYATGMLGRHEEALACLEDDVCQAVQPAMELRLRLLHRLGRFEEAVALGQRHLARLNDAHSRVVISMILFDRGDLTAAEAEASQALDSADGATTAGLIALEQGNSALASQLFESALARNPGSGRALLGRGLALTADGDFAKAADTLETAADMLGDHSGAWVTAGWARLMEGESEIAEADFRKAMAMDPGFSEAAGGLAMALLRQGNDVDAGHYARAALRLDPQSLSGQFVRSLLTASTGDTNAAQDGIRSLLAQPLRGNGPTLGGVLSRRRQPGT